MSMYWPDVHVLSPCPCTFPMSMYWPHVHVLAPCPCAGPTCTCLGSSIDVNRQHHAFSVVGPSVWNGLPLALRLVPGLCLLICVLLQPIDHLARECSSVISLKKIG